MTPHTALIGPGWAQLLEHLHGEIEEARSLRADDAAHRGKLVDMLLSARQEIDRLRAELQADRAERDHLRPPHATLDAAPGPVPPRERSPLHTAIVQLLAHHPDGLSAGAIARAVHTSKSLGDVLAGMARRGHVERRAPGVYGLPVGELVGAPALNGVGP
jgi:hypothetical protein